MICTSLKDFLETYQQHFLNILYILGINYESTSGETNPGGVTLSADQILFITDALSEESTNRSFQGKMYYSLDDVAAYLNSSTAWQIEREAGSGALTADELKALMDSYIALYESNRSVEREYFAGYLIGAIRRTTLMWAPMSMNIHLTDCSCSCF